MLRETWRKKKLFKAKKTIWFFALKSFFYRGLAMPKLVEKQVF